MTRAQLSYNFLWLSLALLPLLTLSLLLPIQPYDYWWYLRLGRDTLIAGAIPQVDTFTFTQAGTPVVYHSWLAALLMWVTYQAGGLTLTFLLKGLLIGVTYGLVYFLNRRAGSGPRLAALLTVLAGLAGSNNWGMRPQLFVYPLFLVTVWLLWSPRPENDPKALWPLAVISFLWVNLHGSFPLLFVLIAGALVLGEGDRKQLALWGLAALVVTLLNPRGVGAWSYVQTMLAAESNQRFSIEWAGPANVGWQMNLFFVWLLAWLPLALLSARKPSRLEWAWYLGFAWLALSGVRYVFWFLLLIGPLTSRLISAWAARETGPQTIRPAANLSMAGLLLLLPLSVLPSLRMMWWPAAPATYDEITTPVAATDWLKMHPELPGQLWSDFGFSSYLEFALPERPVWIDTRFEVFPVSQWEQYLAIEAARPGWEDILERDGINLLMLSTSGQAAMIASLSQDPAWCERYHDPHAVIFTRGICSL